MIRKSTGACSQLNSMTTAFLSANGDTPLEEVEASVCTIGFCGEIAYDRMNNLDCNYLYRNYIIDAVYNLTPVDLEKGEKYEIR